MSEDSEPRVSVVIPARNEEAAIACAVRSVAGQRGVMEIVVVDDQSTDRTAQVLEDLKHEVSALRVIRIESLPEGWLGKTHAVAVGAREARGEWLLFTDADTEHLPGSLAALLERAKASGADLLSLSPGQRTPTWWEKSVIPMIYVLLAGLFRFEDVNDPLSPVAAANGQYILVRRSVYERVGGHEAVRGEVLEDVALARGVKSAGGRLLFLPGAAWVRTRMYCNFRDLWQGWTKNLYLLYGGRLRPLAFDVAKLWLLDLFLLFSVPLFLVAIGRDGIGPLSATFFLLLIAGTLLFSSRRYERRLRALGFDASLLNWQIPGSLLVSLLLLNSARVHRGRGRIEWKGRSYPARDATAKLNKVRE